MMEVGVSPPPHTEGKKFQRAVILGRKASDDIFGPSVYGHGERIDEISGVSTHTSVFSHDRSASLWLP